jgi:hypothetical protein
VCCPLSVLLLTALRCQHGCSSSYYGCSADEVFVHDVLAGAWSIRSVTVENRFFKLIAARADGNNSDDKYRSRQAYEAVGFK